VSKLVPMRFAVGLFIRLLSTARSVLCIWNEVQLATVVLCGNEQQRDLK